MTQSVISINNAKTVAKTPSTSYDIPKCLEAMDNWFKQDKDFMKNLISKAVEYEQSAGVSFISHEGFSNSIVYSWPTFFSKFKPSLTNYERTKSRVEKGQLLYKTENQTPNFYFVGASHYEGDDKPVLDGFHTRSMEAIARIMGFISFKDGENERSFMKNVIVLIFKKPKEELDNHTDIVVNQDSYLNVMDMRMTNRILAAEYDGVIDLKHPFAQSQTARKNFSSIMKIENTIKVFDHKEPKAILSSMINSTCAYQAGGGDLKDHDVNFNLWKSTSKSLGYENVQMSEAVYASIMCGAYTLLSKKNNCKLEDVQHTVEAFMSMDIKTLKDFSGEKGEGDVSAKKIINNLIIKIEDCVYSRCAVDEMTNSNTTGNTMANFAGVLMKDAILTFHAQKGHFE